MRVEQILNFGKVKRIKVGYAPTGKPIISVIVYYIDGLLIDSIINRTPINFSFKLSYHLGSDFL